MLANLIAGGRGGTVRLKLYLSMVLLAGSKHTHEIHGANTIVDVASANWARALALPDAIGKGARRVADAQTQLADRQLIELERRHGQAPRIKLLHPSGSGQPWVEPGMPYIRIPLDLWSQRWIWSLSAKEIAVYVALLDLCGGKGLDGTGGPQPLSGTHLARYGISADTWRIASGGLQRLGLIRTDVETVRMDLDVPRRRKRYQLDPDGMSRPAYPLHDGGR